MPAINQNSPAALRYQISRRTFLRGTGVVMALPWLESLPVWGAPAAPASPAAPTPYPQRFAAVFMGNGINSQHWWAKGAGAEMELGKTLKPLEPFRTKLNVISGLYNRAATGVGIHPGMTGNLLSGLPLTKGAVLHGGVSMDQILASRLGHETTQPSLILGCEQPITGYHETNFSMAYSSHISWENADSPVPMEVYPSLAFDSLFENRGSRRTQSILDRVKEDAASLNRQVSAADHAKLDEYLNSVREVEKRVDRMRSDQQKAVDNARTRGQSADYESIARYYVGHLAYLAGRLEAMPEGEGTVLDHTCLMYLSNMWSGTKHDNSKVPLLTVGGFGGTLATGRILDYTDKGDENRKLCSLYLSLMDRAGVSLPRFGDADTRLAGI